MMLVRSTYDKRILLVVEMQGFSSKPFKLPMITVRQVRLRLSLGAHAILDRVGTGWGLTNQINDHRGQGHHGHGMCLNNRAWRHSFWWGGSLGTVRRSQGCLMALIDPSRHNGDPLKVSRLISENK